MDRDVGNRQGNQVKTLDVLELPEHRGNQNDDAQDRRVAGGGECDMRRYDGRNEIKSSNDLRLNDRRGNQQSNCRGVNDRIDDGRRGVNKHADDDRRGVNSHTDDGCRGVNNRTDDGRREVNDHTNDGRKGPGTSSF